MTTTLTVKINTQLDESQAKPELHVCEHSFYTPHLIVRVFFLAYASFGFTPFLGLGSRWGIYC